MTRLTSEGFVMTGTHRTGRDASAPRVRLPAGACDSHMHVVGPLARYPFNAARSLTPPEATLADYYALCATLGIERHVIVQPSFFGADNACTLDSVERSAGRARAVVVVEPEVTAATLRSMHERGARGVRAQMIARGGMSFDAIETVGERIAPLGWHLQLYLDARDLPELAPRLRRLPVPVVFDHMAHVHRDSGIDEPGFAVLLELLAAGRAWVKLSGALFRPSAERARRLVDANPERVLWGTDWPHVGYQEGTPDDVALVDALDEWIPDEQVRARILVGNPDRLYFNVT